jgi:hypothetical protein
VRCEVWPWVAVGWARWQGWQGWQELRVRFPASEVRCHFFFSFSSFLVFFGSHVSYFLLSSCHIFIFSKRITNHKSRMNSVSSFRTMFHGRSGCIKRVIFSGGWVWVSMQVCMCCELGCCELGGRRLEVGGVVGVAGSIPSNWTMVSFYLFSSGSLSFLVCPFRFYFILFIFFIFFSCLIFLSFMCSCVHVFMLSYFHIFKTHRAWTVWVRSGRCFIER